MWFICNGAGICCFLFGYCCLIALEFNINFIALHDLFKEGSPIAYIVCIIFQIIVAFIIWAHISCMTENPGALPLYHKNIRQHLLSPEMSRMYQIVKNKVEQNRTDSNIEEIKEDITVNQNSEKDELNQQLLSRDIEENIRIDEATIKRLTGLFTNFCNKCNSLKPPRAHHCSICNRCIARMDHHCPWMNNCIGVRNIKLFLVMLVYIAIGTLYTLIVDISCLVHCFSEKCYVFAHESVLLLFGGSVVLCLIFLLFSIMMFMSQFGFIINDTSTIEIMKKVKIEKKKSSWELIKATFGGELSYKWFLPLRINLDLTIESQYL